MSKLRIQRSCMILKVTYPIKSKNSPNKLKITFNNYNIIVRRFLFIEIGVEHDELIKSRGYIR